MEVLKVIFKLENVMVNGFNLEENYEKELKRRVGLKKEIDEELRDINSELREMYLKREKMKKDIEAFKERMMLLMDLKKWEMGNENIEITKGKIEIINGEMNRAREDKKKIEKEKKLLSESIKSLRMERDEIKKEIMEEKKEVMMKLRNKDKEMTLKGMKEDLEKDFENKKVRKEAYEILKSLLKMKSSNPELRIMVVSDMRMLKVNRLLANNGLDFCEVMNSNDENWKKMLEEEGENMIYVEKKEDLKDVMRKVKRNLEIRR